MEQASRLAGSYGAMEHWQMLLLILFPSLLLADWKILWCSGWLSNDPAAKHGHVQAVSGGSPRCASLSSAGRWVRARWSPSAALQQEELHMLMSATLLVQELLQLPASSAGLLSHHHHAPCFSSPAALPPAAKH